MVLFGIAVRRFVLCFGYRVVEMLTVPGGLYCPVGGWVLVFGDDSWSLSLPLPLPLP